MQTFVAGEIAVYEYDCTGTSRREHILTDRARAERGTAAVGHACDTQLNRRHGADAPVGSSQLGKPGATAWSHCGDPGPGTASARCLPWIKDCPSISCYSLTDTRGKPRM